MRMITYCKALNEALFQEMERDPSIFIYGIGVPDHKCVFGSLEGILERFGAQRCFDTPLSEDAMTGFGLGAAISGLRPIHVHIRADFMLLAMNQLANMVSSFRYSSCGRLKVPLVITVFPKERMLQAPPSSPRGLCIKPENPDFLISLYSEMLIQDTKIILARDERCGIVMMLRSVSSFP